ncbi:MAG: TRAP transporter large permease subunit [Clostridia bacterium]|nr:TRAP transporter large permease subunit [Clostridia bacterium]
MTAVLMLLVFIVIFLVLAIIRVPLAHAMLGASLASILLAGQSMNIVASTAYSSIDVFAYLAIPGFVFAGNLMLHGRIAESILDEVNKLVRGSRVALGDFAVLLSMLFGTPAMLAFLSAVYYREREARGETPSDTPLPPESPQAARVLRRVLCVLVIFTLGNNVFLAAFRATGNAATAELLTRPTITAHRGDSAVAPENTLPAFESAIHNLADFAELDVQLSRDGVPVVIHDYDLKRLAGTDRQVSELTLRELKQLDVGRWFSPAYQNTRIPTLDEVIRATKGRIKLNIELKPSALPGLEAAVVEVIRAHNLESDCVVASLYYDCLQRVHALAPELKTVYVTAVAYGNFDELDAADVISMESTFVTPSLVDRIKSSGREVYVWTVNHESRIQLMLESGVDSVITDDPVKARAILYAEYAPSFLTQLIRMLQAL